MLTQDEMMEQDRISDKAAAHDNLHERERMLEGCLRATARELIKLMQEAHDDKAVDEYISDWFDAADDEIHQYDHIGR